MPFHCSVYLLHQFSHRIPKDVLVNITLPCLSKSTRLCVARLTQILQIINEYRYICIQQVSIPSHHTFQLCTWLNPSFCGLQGSKMNMLTFHPCQTCCTKPWLLIQKQLSIKVGKYKAIVVYVCLKLSEHLQVYTIFNHSLRNDITTMLQQCIPELHLQCYFLGQGSRSEPPLKDMPSEQIASTSKISFNYKKRISGGD